MTLEKEEERREKEKGREERGKKGKGGGGMAVGPLYLYTSARGGKDTHELTWQCS